MKVLRFHAPGDVRIEDAPIPEITDDEVLDLLAPEED